MTKPTKRKIHSETNGNGAAESAATGNGIGAAANSVDLTPWIKASEAMFNGMMTLGQEMGEFATARLRENMEFTSTVMRCGDPQEAVRLEMDYARHATQQYLNQASRLLQRATELSQSGWAPLEAATRDTLKRAEQP
ncbi:MAG: phasin family protein [Dongiaceae bacterium]